MVDSAHSAKKALVTLSQDKIAGTMSFQQTDLNDLKRAKKLLEKQGVAVRFLNLAGNAIEKGFKLLPHKWSEGVGKVTQAALWKAVHAAIFTMKDTPGKQASNMWHKSAVVATGFACGLLGLPTLAVDIPISTTIMLRSIADVARSEGERINDVESKIACLEVFAFSGPKKGDDASETGYFAVRLALAQSVARAAEYITEKGMVREGAPALVRLIMLIAERLSIRISAKVAAQAIPAVGAVGGALINMLFINHFQRIARGHFIIRRLERKYGEEAVKAAYMRI